MLKIKNNPLARMYFTALISMSIWMIAEDLDSPQIVWFIYFMFLGMNG